MPLLAVLLVLPAGCVTTGDEVKEIVETAVTKPQVIAACGQALLDRPAMATTQRCIADVYYNRGNLAKSQAAYLDYLEQSPYDHEARLDLISIMIQRRQPEKAKAQLELLLAQQADSALVHRYLGMAESLSGHCGPATAAFERAVALDPEDAFSKSLLAQSKMGKCREKTEVLVAKAAPKGRGGTRGSSRRPNRSTRARRGNAQVRSTSSRSPPATPVPEIDSGPFPHHGAGSRD